MRRSILALVLAAACGAPVAQAPAPSAVPTTAAAGAAEGTREVAVDWRGVI